MKLVFIILLLISGYSHVAVGANTIALEETHDVVADFELHDADNQLHRLSDYQGQWVVVNFWATWCGPCIKEIPELIQFHQQYHKEGVTVIGINFEELSVEQLKQAIREFRINYPVLKIGSVPLVPFEPLKGLPSTFVVSPDGRLVKSWVGPINEKALKAYVLPKLVNANIISRGSSGRK
jgi:thiol-disulfide isomerase/thioredoxin